jgi:fumarylacetoacetase
MRAELNTTHDPAHRSWVESANAAGCDFPIQNLPFGLFRSPARPDSATPRAGVALGDQIIDLAAIAGHLDGPAQAAARAALGPSLLPLLRQPPEAVSQLRASLSRLFGAGAPGRDAHVPDAAVAALVPMNQAEMVLPLRPPGFADFCCSIEHIRRMAQSTGRPVARCADRLPVSYNGRASSVAVSGTPVRRPRGQFESPPGTGEVQYGPEPRLDYELEFGAWLRGGSALGQALSVAEADALLFGCSLVNDWSARGIQAFEMMLGPHLGKSFLTTVSPWIVTMEALAPFRVPARGRAADEAAVPDHLLDPADRAQGGLRVALTAELQTANGQTQQIARSGFEDMFWTFAQMVAHQASSGAPLEAGDLLGSGTVSGPAPHARACLAELTERGGNPLVFGDGSRRVWLQDGDSVCIRGRAHAPGAVSIGFGECRGQIQPVLSA